MDQRTSASVLLGSRWISLHFTCAVAPHWSLRWQQRPRNAATGHYAGRIWACSEDGYALLSGTTVACP
uniref:Uncharacterized protein n=1 Tax=Hyaloperonospora arabidopsidis (strain Emoy2) TaxID=559515 RepID=M4C3L8_HYAAE